MAPASLQYALFCHAVGKPVDREYLDELIKRDDRFVKCAAITVMATFVASVVGAVVLLVAMP